MDALQRLIEIEAIKDLKARYFRGVDMREENTLRDVFCEDVQLDYSRACIDPQTGVNHIPGAGSTTGSDVGIAMIIETQKGMVSVHHASIPEIRILDESNAEAIWPMVDRLQFPAGSAIRELIGYGYYYDSYKKIDGEWRIQTLRVERLRIDIV